MDVAKHNPFLYCFSRKCVVEPRLTGIKHSILTKTPHFLCCSAAYSVTFTHNYRWWESNDDCVIIFCVCLLLLTFFVSYSCRSVGHIERIPKIYAEMKYFKPLSLKICSSHEMMFSISFVSICSHFSFTISFSSISKSFSHSEFLN